MSNEEIQTNPRITIFPNKDFTKGASLVFLLHHYGQSNGDAKYKAEQILAGNKVNATLYLATTMEEVERDFKKLGLEIELQNPEVFFIKE